MDGTWRYRIWGQEFGPVSGETLCELIGDGHLGPDDEIQDGTGAWLAVKDRPDLKAASLGRGRDGDAEVPLESGLAQLLESVSQRDAGAASTRASNQKGAQWYCRTLGEELGPFGFEELLAMVREGGLSPSDELRQGTGDWEQAGSIIGLFAEAPAAPVGETSVPLALSPQRRAITPDPSGTRTPAPAKAPETAPAENGAPQEASAEDKWAGFFDAVEAKEQKRSRTFVAAPAQDSTAEQKGSVGSAASMPVPKSAPSMQATTASAPAISPQASSPAASVFVPTPRSRSLSMPSLGVGSLVDKITGAFSGGEGKPSGKSLAILAAAVVILGVLYIPWPFGGKPGAEEYVQVEAIWNKVKELYESDAGDDAWRALYDESQPILDAAQEKLAPIVEKHGRNEPLAQHLLWMVDSHQKKGPTKADGFLRKVLAAGRGADDELLRNAASVMRDVEAYAPDDGT